MGDCVQFPGCVPTEIRALWKVLSQQAIGVFVGVSLPRAWGSQKKISSPVSMRRSAAAPFPLHGPKSATDAVAREVCPWIGLWLCGLLSAVAGKWWTVLDAQALLIAMHARQVKHAL
ncbi:hypothetical protein X747_32995 [Mesorhizobium sp. LNJC384A00]|nr:hypothetical protein X747_32995 [Mesorhizobium sp. LNJC384A00]